jgi:hypothetical protein
MKIKSAGRERVPIEVCTYDQIPVIDNRTAITLVIGVKDRWGDFYCRQAAAAWKHAYSRRPASCTVQVSGYDDDPRELWEIPEVRDYVQRWARMVGLNDFTKAKEAIGSARFMGVLPLLGLCGAYGTTVPEDMVFTVEADFSAWLNDRIEELKRERRNTQ